MNLDDILQRFSEDIRAYVNQEVARQVGRQEVVESSMVSADMNQSLSVLRDISGNGNSEVGNGSQLDRLINDFANSNSSSIVDETNFLKSLEKLRDENTLDKQESDDVQALLNKFGSSNAVPGSLSVAPDLDSPLDQLAAIKAGTVNKYKDNSLVDKLLSTDAGVVAQSPIVTTSVEKPLSGLRLLLSKIRLRKNLSSNL